MVDPVVEGGVGHLLAQERADRVGAPARDALRFHRTDRKTASQEVVGAFRAGEHPEGDDVLRRLLPARAHVAAHDRARRPDERDRPDDEQRPPPGRPTEHRDDEHDHADHADDERVRVAQQRPQHHEQTQRGRRRVRPPPPPPQRRGHDQHAERDRERLGPDHAVPLADVEARAEKQDRAETRDARRSRPQAPAGRRGQPDPRREIEQELQPRDGLTVLADQLQREQVDRRPVRAQQADDRLVARRGRGSRTSRNRGPRARERTARLAPARTPRPRRPPTAASA